MKTKVEKKKNYYQITIPCADVNDDESIQDFIEYLKYRELIFHPEFSQNKLRVDLKTNID